MKNILKNTLVEIIISIVAIIAVTWGSISLLSRHGTSYTNTTVSHRDLVESVSGNGNVVSDQSVTLAFNMQGRVAVVSATVGSTTYVGQVLASLDTGTLRASIVGAEADVLSANAHLKQTQNGARPEELAVYNQKYSDATIALMSAIKNADLSIEAAVVGKADILFTNGNTVNPTINIRTQSDSEKRSIEIERMILRDSLNKFATTLSGFNQSILDGSISTSSIISLRILVRDQLSLAKTYLDHLALITADLTPGSSGQSQTAIDGERLIVNTAAQQLAGAIAAEQSVDAAWSSARDALILVRAGSTDEDIMVAQAALSKAQSVLQGLQSQLRQSYIIAPYVGLITAVNVKVGEIYVPGISASQGINIIGDGSYKVEIYVPETDIGKINIDNPVDITFDAFGPNVIIPGHVGNIDPAETVRSGVNTYKLTINFDNATDDRIKSGLTTNVVINTKTAVDVLAVPSRAVITRGVETIVLVQQAGLTSYIEKPVSIGVKSRDGYTEIVSGLNEGDTIASFGVGK